jgi:Tat protein secretion system quality control protein TatD with DNase activity
MGNLIKCIVAVVLMGSYAILISWIVCEKRKNRQEREARAKYIKARGLLRLSDKPYMMPKQGQENEIEVIQKPQDPPTDVPETCQKVNTWHN